MATAKSQLADNQNARRLIEKDVAVHQGRLSKFRETAMAVKTNIEYHAVQKEISFAQTEIKALEDKILERMLEADDITSSLKAAEADLAAEQTAIAAARKAMTAEHAQLEASLARIAGERTSLVSALDEALLRIFEQVAKRRNGIAVARGTGRHLHHLSRPAAPAGVQHRAAKRADPPVRQLPAFPLFRAQGGSSRRRADLNPDSIVAYIDGGARGNPGPAGYGVRVEQPDGTLVEEFGGAIGVATNNVAEYRGLLAALEWARAHDCSRVHVRSDSLLLVQQMLGNYKVKNPGLQPLYTRARLLTLEIGRVTFEHIERAKNAHADRLANAAMDWRVKALNARRPRKNGAGRGSDSGAGLQSAEATHPSHRIRARGPALHLSPFPRRLRALRISRPSPARPRPPRRTSPLRSARSLTRTRSSSRPRPRAIWMAHPFSAVPTDIPSTRTGDDIGRIARGMRPAFCRSPAPTAKRGRVRRLRRALTMPSSDGAMIGDGVVHYAVPPRRFWDNVAYT